MPTVHHAGADVAYQVTGQGPGLMLIHGTGGTGATTWAPLLRTWSTERTIVMPDLRGSGETVDDGGRLALDELADDIAAVADDAGLETFDVVGFSLGAAVAASLAASNGDRVRSLVLIAGRASSSDARTKLQFDLWSELQQRDERLLARLWLLTGMSPRFVASIPVDQLEAATAFAIEPGMGRQSDLNTRIDLGSILPGIGARTLVIGCSDDAVVPLDQVRSLADAIPGAGFTELQSGHLVVLEAPELLAATVDDFLNSAPRHVAAGASSSPNRA